MRKKRQAYHPTWCDLKDRHGLLTNQNSQLNSLLQLEYPSCLNGAFNFALEHLDPAISRPDFAQKVRVAIFVENGAVFAGVVRGGILVVPRVAGIRSGV